jgi:2-polyprenyl-6-methoxyphenol hydroxylase-like FAD-dependent oxidoreductase
VIAPIAPLTAGRDSPDVIVIGGSLAGLSAALGAARSGAATLVLERSPGSMLDGAGLGVDLDLLAAASGRHDLIGDLPVLHDRPRDSAAYNDVRSWLRRCACEHPLISLNEQTEVLAAAIDDSGRAIATAEDRSYGAAIIIGADGIRSVARRAVAPHQPDAQYAGYLLWRALVSDRDLPRADAVLPVHDTMRVLARGRYQLVGYAVPGEDGSVQPGRRRLSLAWYDGERTELLRQLGCIGRNGVLGSLRPEQIPADVADDLRRRAEIWPSPWPQVVGRAIDSRRLFGFPVAEYVPSTIANGPLAIVGDAAHAASPMTGSGFRMALLDAIAVGQALARYGATEQALASYAESQLGPARELASAGRRWSEHFLGI